MSDEHARRTLQRTALVGGKTVCSNCGEEYDGKRDYGNCRECGRCMACYGRFDYE